MKIKIVRIVGWAIVVGFYTFGSISIGISFRVTSSDRGILFLMIGILSLFLALQVGLILGRPIDQTERDDS